MYKLEKCIDGEWYYEGTYISLNSLAEACICLGSNGIKQVRVTEKKKTNPNLSDLYKPEGWGTGVPENIPVFTSSMPDIKIDFVPDYLDTIKMAKEDEAFYEYICNEEPKKYERRER